MNTKFLLALLACLLCASVALAGDRFYGNAAAADASQWASGCCEHEPLPSDHLWDDYCNEKGQKHPWGLFQLGGCHSCQGGAACGIPACSRWRPRADQGLPVLHNLRGFGRRHHGDASCESCGSSCEMPVGASHASDAATGLQLVPAPSYDQAPPQVDSVPVVPIDDEDDSPLRPEEPSELRLPEPPEDTDRGT